MNRIKHIINVLSIKKEDVKTLLCKQLADNKFSKENIIALVKTLECLSLAVT